MFRLSSHELKIPIQDLCTGFIEIFVLPDPECRIFNPLPNFPEVLVRAIIFMGVG